MINEIVIGKVYKSTFNQHFRKVTYIDGDKIFYTHGETPECKTRSKMHVDKIWFLRNHAELETLSEIEKLTARVEKLEKAIGV